MTKTQSVILYTVFAGACVITSYLFVDLPVIEFFHSLKGTAFSETFEPITKLGESQWYLVAGLILWIVYRKKSNHLSYGGLLLFFSVALSGIVVNLLKTLLGRARPNLYFKEQIYGFDFFHLDYSWLSFPSGHAATALGAASALALLYPQYRAPLYSTGIIVAISRIVLVQHYPSDVILGSLLGYAATVYLYRRFFKEKCMPSPTEKQQEKPYFATLVFLIFVSFFAGLGSTPLFDVDEGAFSEATREMIASGNYLTTYLYGEPRFDKPILIYWLQALSVKLFGLNEFAFRLPSALASTVWGFALYFFTVKLLDKRTAFISTAVMVLSLQVTIIGKAAIADALLNCMLAISMFTVFLYYKERKQHYILLAFAAIGLGTLTKGPVAILIPTAVSFFFFLAMREFRAWFKAVLHPAGLAVFALIVLPWYTLEYLDQGMAFIEGFFFKHNIGRFNSPMEKHGGSLWYYIPVLLLGISPSTALIAPVLKKIRSLITDPLNSYLLTWFGFVFIFFSLSGTKLPHYIIYGYTPLFILMAQGMRSVRNALPINLWPAAMLVLLAFAPAIIGQVRAGINDPYISALLENGLSLMESSGHTLLLSVAAAAVVGLSFVPGLSVLKRFIAGCTVFCIAVNLHIMPLAGKLMQEPVKEAALIAKKQGYKIVMWKINNPSFLVYSETLTERRKPEPGEITLTNVKHLAKLRNPIVIYEKNGIVLAKLPDTVNKNGNETDQ